VVAPYQAISRLPVSGVDDTFRGEVANLNRLSGFSDEVKNVLKSDRVEAITSKIQDLKSLTGEEALALIRDFRDKSKNLHKQITQGTGGADASESALVKVYDDAADIVENQLERRAMASGDIDLVRDLRKSRKLIAETYQYEKATDLGTGDIDASVFAKRLAEGLPIDGNMRVIGMAAGQFPESFGTPGMRSTHSFGVGAAGGVQNLLQYPVRRGMAGLLTSDLMQNRLRRGVKDYRPLRERLGYAQVEEPVVSLPRVTPNLPMVRPYSGEFQPAGTPMPEQPYRPDWIPGRPGNAPDVTPQVAGLLEQGANPLPNFRYERGVQSAAADAVAAAQEAAAPRATTGRGTLFDIDPITGKLVPVDRGIKGATPLTIESTDNNLSSAVNKMASGQSFRLGAEERIAWNARKAELESAAPELSGLSDEAIAGKVANRDWVNKRVEKLKTEYAEWTMDAAKRFNASRATNLNERANTRRILTSDERASQKQSNAESARRLQVLVETRKAKLQADIDALESMSDSLAPSRAGEQQSMSQGPKTRAAQREQTLKDLIR
jgi:hypothetical protein